MRTRCDAVLPSIYFHRTVPRSSSHTVPRKKKRRRKIHSAGGGARMGNVSETPTPTTCLKSTAVHLQFVRQYAPRLYRRAFLTSELRRKGNPAIRLPFVLQYASHLYGSSTVCDSEGGVVGRDHLGHALSYYYCIAMRPQHWSLPVGQDQHVEPAEGNKRRKGIWPRCPNQVGKLEQDSFIVGAKSITKII